MSTWTQILDSELVFVLLLNFFVLVTSRLPSAIYLVGLQGVLIGLMPLVVHQIANEQFDVRGALLSAGTIMLKGFIIPRMLIYALREVGVEREIHPIIGFVPQLLLGVAGTALALVMASTLPLKAEHAHFLVVPAALSTVLTGCLLMVTRRRAITQALGYLVLENGVFLFGLLLVDAVPFLVEVGVLLDVFVGIFVMGIIIGHISRGFASDSTQHLSSLKD